MRAVLCGYYGMGNGGDEALLATLLQMLPDHVTPVVLSGDPVETAQRYGVETVPRKALGPVMKALLQDATSVQNSIYYCGLMVLAQWLGLKTIAWGQGIGPLNHTFTRQLGRFALKQCDAVSVRDRGSAAWLDRWHRSGLQAPDPVWALNAEPVKGLWDLPAPRVAVALRPHPGLTETRLDQFTQALAAFQTATNTCILLVPFQPTKDRPIAEYIQARLSGATQIYTLDNPRQLKGLFRGVDMTIGMRFHALIMAAAEGCRCFAISYDPKVSYLMTDLNLPGIDLTLSDPVSNSALAWPEDVTRLTQQWLKFYADGDPLSPDQIQSRVDRALMHQDILHSLL